MRIFICLFLTIVMIVGCPQSEKDSSSSDTTVSGQNSVSTNTDIPHITCLFSATESDQWTREMIDMLGAETGIDPWETASVSENLDIYGPYETELYESEVKVSVVLCGFTGVVDLLGQQELGRQVRDWLDQNDVDAVWLDGDPLQFQVGMHLDTELPIVFSGVVIDKNLYYENSRNVTGVYKRFSLPRILATIWSEEPEARQYLLISDDDALNRGRVDRFLNLETLLPEGHHMYSPQPVESWDELRSVLDKLSGDMDAVVLCGIGGEQTTGDFLDTVCPPDLLDGVEIPVIVLGPSKVDQCGGTVLSIKPSVHARIALSMLSRITEGTDPRSIPFETPDDMAEFRFENETED